MPILVGIDGTGGGAFRGAARDQRYAADFANSFVRRLCPEGRIDGKYFPGPATFGGGLVDAVDRGLAFIKASKAAKPNLAVLLMGYSRGAAGAVAVAKKLKGASIDVSALLLFDCVDRHLFIDAEIVPNNVGHVMHVIRDPRSKSRESFGNDGLQYTTPTIYPAPRPFLCTHGGMGGTPWLPGPKQPVTDLIKEGLPDGKTTISFAEDARVSQQVWNFVQPFCSTHGFIGG